MTIKQAEIKKIRSYCAQCSCLCPTVYTVQDGVFVKAEPDRKNPVWVPLCPKGAAGPELVYDPMRLKYPMKRTNPKRSPDPGWQRISWDEAMNTVARKLTEIRSKFGPEAVVICRTSPGGSAGGDLRPWFHRLADALGTPNVVSHTHVCQWHRDVCSNYTYGRGGIGTPDIENASCVLVWGSNLQGNSPKRFAALKKAQERGAKVIVVDPRRTPVAARADLWLRVNPGTDGALILGIVNVLLREQLYDREFTRDWTNAPFLVRRDTGNLLRGKEIDAGAVESSYVIWDTKSGSTVVNETASQLMNNPKAQMAIFGSYRVKLTSGQEVMTDTVLELLAKLVGNHTLEMTEAVTGIPLARIEEAARMIGTIKPMCYYTFTGIEEHTNATQTNRALCILYTLTGNYDSQGGNVLLPTLGGERLPGLEALPSEAQKRRLGFEEKPLGPPGRGGSVSAYDLYTAILEGKPYPVKAVMGFGGDLIIADSESKRGREAFRKLDFYAQADLYLTPSAELADIVLPAASFYESEFARLGFSESLKTWDQVMWRAPAVPPQYESRPDLDIVFDLATRMEIGDKFWQGNIEAAFNAVLRATGLTLEQLKGQPGGISLKRPLAFKKYGSVDATTGRERGFDTPSRRIEIFSQVFKDGGYNPLPVYDGPRWTGEAKADLDKEYPLTLISTRVLQFCHGQHRSLPSLRKAVPGPFVEIHPHTARSLSIKSEDNVILETPHGRIKLKAKVTDTVAPGVVSTQMGWWQACPALNMPAYDPYSSQGANVNIIYDADVRDPISGSLPYKSYRCRVRKVKEQK